MLVWKTKEKSLGFCVPGQCPVCNSEVRFELRKTRLWVYWVFIPIFLAPAKYFVYCSICGSFGKLNKNWNINKLQEIGGGKDYERLYENEHLESGFRMVKPTLEEEYEGEEFTYAEEFFIDESDYWAGSTEHLSEHRNTENTVQTHRPAMEKLQYGLSILVFAIGVFMVATSIAVAIIELRPPPMNGLIGGVVFMVPYIYFLHRYGKFSSIAAFFTGKSADYPESESKS